MPAQTLGTGVKPTSTTQMKLETAAEAISIGQAVYRETSSKKVKLASTASSEKANALGFALTTCTSADQPVLVAWEGDLDNTTTVVVGGEYFLSATPGSIGPAAELGTNDWVTFMGFGGTSATRFKIGIRSSGVQHA